MMCALGIGTASGMIKKSTGGGAKKSRTRKKKALVCVSLTIIEVTVWFKEIHEGGRMTSPFYDGGDK
jgi:hypothetical protein